MGREPRYSCCFQLAADLRRRRRRVHPERSELRTRPPAPQRSLGRARSSLSAPHLPRRTWGQGKQRGRSPPGTAPAPGGERRSRVPRLRSRPRPPLPPLLAGLRPRGCAEAAGRSEEQDDQRGHEPRALPGPFPPAQVARDSEPGSNFSLPTSAASTLCFTSPFHKFNLQTSAFLICSK